MGFEIRLIAPDMAVEAVMADIVPALGIADADELADGLAQMCAVARLAPWGTYIAWRDGAAVGSCGFKNAPGAGDPPEIGYMTFPAARGTGVAAEMTRAMLAIAADHGQTIIIAHTLPEHNASARVLQRCGFVFAGDAEDPDEGPVWRWQHTTG